MVLASPPNCVGVLVGAADGADDGANVAKSRPPRALDAEELLVGKSTRNPVGAGVGAVLTARALGAGDCEDVVVPPLPCPGLLSKIGLGIGTPTETGGPVWVDARGVCSPLP